MKVSTTWIKQLLRRTMSDEQVIAGLEQGGIEIEQYMYSKPFDKNLVVGLIKKVVQHPGADRLHVVTVDDGREELTIVCGAPNVKVGMYAPLARVGAVLPDGTKITPAKLRGELSNGMLCSGRELGLSEDHNGLLELPDESEAGTVLCDLYPADSFVDVKTAANRFDLLGVTGLAREVAAMTENELQSPTTAVLDATPDGTMITDLDPGCARFMVAELTVNGSLPSPDWMVARLAVSGLRSLGLLVDVTNYVMLETAQPLHAYDADKLELPFGVRVAKARETLKTLDDQARKLFAGDLLVTAGEQIVGLAGVRGGAATEISPATKRIYLEAATFDGAMIRTAAKRANLRTDASARYERRLPVELPKMALQRAIYLLTEYGDGVVKRWSEAGSQVSKFTPITLTAEHASRVVGIPLGAKAIAAALARLELSPSLDGEVVTVTPPWWRPDLKEAEDLVEDVVRVTGYDKIPATLPQWRPRELAFDRTRPALGRLRQLLSGAGLFEVMTYSFVSAEQLGQLGRDLDGHLKLLNPLSSEQAYLRSDLLASHVAVAARNRRYGKSFGFYELSNVFVPQAPGTQPHEVMMLGITVVRPELAYAAVKGWLDALAELVNVQFELEPAELDTPWVRGRVAQVKLSEVVIGVIGQVHPHVTTAHKLGGELAYVQLEIAALLAASTPVLATRRSRFPEARRDVTVVMPDTVTWQAVAAALVGMPDLRVEFGSDYAGDGVSAGHKSMSLKLRLSSDDHTPTEAEIADIEVKVRSILHRLFGAQDQV